MSTIIKYNRPALALLTGVQVTRGSTYILRGVEINSNAEPVGDLYMCINHNTPQMVNLSNGRTRDTYHKELWEEVDLEINVILK